MTSTMNNVMVHHRHALPLRWTEVEFMRCQHRRSIPFPNTTSNMLSLFSKAAPRVLSPLATTASRPSFPLIQKTAMSTCKSRRMTTLNYNTANTYQPSVPTTSSRPASCSMSPTSQRLSQEAAQGKKTIQNACIGFI